MDLKQTLEQVNSQIKVTEAKIESLKAELSKLKKLKKVIEE